jgi:hypothetical protein
MNVKIKPPLDPTFMARLFEDRGLPDALAYLLVVLTIEPRKNHLGLLSGLGEIGPAQDARRADLVARGAVVARRYGYEKILLQWQAFLASQCGEVEAIARAAPVLP